jgi:hypothetical protein
MLESASAMSRIRGHSGLANLAEAVKTCLRVTVTAPDTQISLIPFWPIAMLAGTERSSDLTNELLTTPTMSSTSLPSYILHDQNSKEFGCHMILFTPAQAMHQNQ